MKLQKEKSVRGRLPDNEPNPVDVHVGNRIRLRRTLLGFSQQFMSNKLGVTFQQVQKYEKGCNRVGASRLFDISKVLRVSMDFFFEDMDKETERQSPMNQGQPHEFDAEREAADREEIDLDPMKRQETLRLVRNYYRISNRKLAQIVFNLIECMSHSNAYLPTDSLSSMFELREKCSKLIKLTHENTSEKKLDKVKKDIATILDKMD